MRVGPPRRLSSRPSPAASPPARAAITSPAVVGRAGAQALPPSDSRTLRREGQYGASFLAHLAVSSAERSVLAPADSVYADQFSRADGSGAQRSLGEMRAPTTTRQLLSVAAIGLAAACGGTVATAQSDGGARQGQGSSGAAQAGPDGASSGGFTLITSIPQGSIDKVDLLFDIDNSASMGDKQALPVAGHPRPPHAPRRSRTASNAAGDRHRVGLPVGQLHRPQLVGRVPARAQHAHRHRQLVARRPPRRRLPERPLERPNRSR